MAAETRSILENNLQVEEGFTFQKSLLALDALSTLAGQFSKEPKLETLINSLLLTVAGQFAVGSALAWLPEADAHPQGWYTGIGKFSDRTQFDDFYLSKKDIVRLIKTGKPVLIRSINETELDSIRAESLLDKGLRVLVPLVHDGNLIGIIGLGERVTSKVYDDDDFDLLTTILKTVTPFIISSYLFDRISALNDWYLEILNSVKQGVFVFGADHRLKNMNNAGRDILQQFGVDKIDRLLKSNPSVSDVFQGETFCGWARMIESAICGEHNTVIENLVAGRDENKRIYNVGLGIINKSDISNSDTVITLDDITSQKASELRLFEVEKFAEKGVMASSIAHELNNFLGLILGGAEIAGMALAKGKTDKVEVTLEKIKANVGRMERFTAGLVDYTRMNTTKTSYSINTIINDVLSFVAVQKKFKGITFFTELDSAVPSIVIDSDQISQLFMNLINNAADAINEAKRKNGEISVLTKLRDDTIILKISDNGVGIKPEVKNKLFKSHLTTKEKGHGYGLVTCARIVENHHGKIEIETELGVGSSFEFLFPVDQSSPQDER